MNEPKFFNKENTLHVINNKKVWESRSVVVQGVLMIKIGKEYYILLTKRSTHCHGEAGKYANVTGFMDWSESGIEALKREYWEETKLFFDKYFNNTNLIYGSLKNPYQINTSPNSNMQNISCRYGFLFEVDTFPEVSETKEASYVEFLPIATVISMINHDEKQFAWNHGKTIKEFIIKATANEKTD